MSELGVSVVLANIGQRAERERGTCKGSSKLVDKGPAQNLFMKMVIVYGRK